MKKRHVILSDGGSQSEGSLILMRERCFAQHDMHHGYGEKAAWAA